MVRGYRGRPGQRDGPGECSGEHVSGGGARQRDGKYRQDSSGCEDGIYPGWRTPADLAYPEEPATAEVGDTLTAPSATADSWHRQEASPAPTRRNDFGSGDDSASKAKLAAVASQVIVEWNPEAATDQKNCSAGRRWTSSIAPPSTPTPAATHHPRRLPRSKGSRDAALATLEADPGGPVGRAEPILHHARSRTPRPAEVLQRPICLTPTATQWHVLGKNTEPANKYGVNAASSWKKGIKGDPNVYVGIVDEGIDISARRAGAEQVRQLLGPDQRHRRRPQRLHR